MKTDDMEIEICCAKTQSSVEALTDDIQTVALFETQVIYQDESDQQSHFCTSDSHCREINALLGNQVSF